MVFNQKRTLLITDDFSLPEADGEFIYDLNRHNFLGFMR